MMAVVDANNKEEIALYSAAGFVKLEDQNSITAYMNKKDK